MSFAFRVLSLSLSLPLLAACTKLSSHNGIVQNGSQEISAIDGKAIYQTNCASCHQSLTTSSKLGRTSQQILTAIATVPAMGSLTKLTREQIDAVANALMVKVPENPSVEITGSDYLPVGTAYTCNAQSRGSDNVGSRRLTHLEITSSIEVLFGADVAADARIVSALNALPKESVVNGVENFSSRAYVNEATLLSFLDLGVKVGDVVFALPAARSRLLKGCDTVTPSTCADRIAAFAVQVFRRPLEVDEKSTLMSLVSTTGGDAGIKLALVRLLASPHFHDLNQLDISVAETNRIKLSSYEVASRLAFQLTGATPDESLIQAAQSNALASLTQLRAQAARLIATPLAQRHFQRFVGNWLQLNSKGDLNPAASSVLGFDTQGLGPALSSELLTFATAEVFQGDAGYARLLTSPMAYPSDAKVARYLGLSQSTNAVAFAGSDYKGILMRPGFLRNGTLDTHPIVRGVVLRRRVLCSNLPSPDTAVVNIRDDEIAKFSHAQFSTREIVTEVTKGASCTGCHSTINPLGFAFEKYGPFGEPRLTESVYANNGSVLYQHPINSTVENPVIPGRSIASVAGPHQLVDELSTAPAAMRCFSQQVFRESRLRRAKVSDGCAIEEMTQKLIGGMSIKEVLIQNVANEDIFWRKVP